MNNELSNLTLESIEQAIKESQIDLYGIWIENPYLLRVQLNNAEEIYFGYSQNGDDGFTWELTNNGSTIALGAMPNQADAKEVAKELYSWLSTVPQCSDCTAFVGYEISTTFANGVYVASAEINCPNCGVSYETQLDGTEEELLEDLLEFGTSRLLEQEEELKEYEVQVNINSFAYIVVLAKDEEHAEEVADSKSWGEWKLDTDFSSADTFQVREMDGEGGYMTTEERANSRPYTENKYEEGSEQYCLDVIKAFSIECENLGIKECAEVIYTGGGYYLLQVKIADKSRVICANENGAQFVNAEDAGDYSIFTTGGDPVELAQKIGDVWKLNRQQGSAPEMVGEGFKYLARTTPKREQNETRKVER